VAGSELSDYAALNPNNRRYIANRPCPELQGQDQFVLQGADELTWDRLQIGACQLADLGMRHLEVDRAPSATSLDCERPDPAVDAYA
jgi:hypothetical protein